MRSVIDHERERARMRALRKTASLATTAAKGLSALGKGTWRAAKTVGGGNVGGAAVLGGGALAASAIPLEARRAAKRKDVILQPWQAPPFDLKHFLDYFLDQEKCCK